ncbi:hypothetical protein AAFF_G00015860 [Aldrovandia affinis]|uniref:C-type lectin domain-containing protein n=1 Tax=Aldrovandia affinis TaxID=143900 RepID=A0AAD7VYJ1_9TELE|nr:hypothetical protein AAFF_G00015860 [Aldrovandia affinis]
MRCVEPRAGSNLNKEKDPFWNNQLRETTVPTEQPAQITDDCLEQGADLVIIESEEEQKFITKHTRGAYYWIGLSDSETEGTWLWVDGTPLQKDKGFFGRGEPNDYKGAEDCAVTLPGRGRDICYAPAHFCFNEVEYQQRRSHGMCCFHLLIGDVLHLPLKF